ncbi:MAG TPA: DUF4382 domain-containing protein [Bacteroidia bacterium]|nr:DUF4382 domain-containing protein [Bacteroidia bacterium]
MKKRNALLILTTVTVSSLFILQACKKDTIGGGPITGQASGNSAIKIKLTDAPANYLEVNVDIKQVRMHISDDSSNTDGWIDLPTNAGIYNLLDLQNGIDTTVVDSTLVPGGKVSQVRFVLGPNSSVMTSDSVLHDLKVPSGEQSGLKINVHKTIPAGQTLHLVLDFDAEKSVHEKGNGDFSMKPVIKIK